MSELRIEIRKLTMKELFLIRKVTGRSVLAELLTAKGAKIDEQMTSALVWVTRQRSEPDLTFDEVFSAPWTDTTVVLDLSDDSPPLVDAGSTTRKRGRPSAGSITSALAS